MPGPGVVVRGRCCSRQGEASGRLARFEQLAVIAVGARSLVRPLLWWCTPGGRERTGLAASKQAAKTKQQASHGFPVFSSIPSLNRILRGSLQPPPTEATRRNEHGEGQAHRASGGHSPAPLHTHSPKRAPAAGDRKRGRPVDCVLRRGAPHQTPQDGLVVLFLERERARRFVKTLLQAQPRSVISAVLLHPETRRARAQMTWADCQSPVSGGGTSCHGEASIQTDPELSWKELECIRRNARGTATAFLVYRIAREGNISRLRRVAAWRRPATPRAAMFNVFCVRSNGKLRTLT